ncbi:MAG: hypothetical protein RLZZ69_1096, partial [Cyanobacteriota bacterium]
SMLNWRFQSQDSPALWREHLLHWRNNLSVTLLKQWLSFASLLKILEISVLIIIALAWIISLIKELS